ncbi:3-phosphoglycerate dehydrogenase [Bordetella genomosp. 10]|uniref:3-phosphoglycerate dehydrogenase n=1 Tax=Bordetella genomosp. 10 TaxID=1416804 RepID=A0A261SJI9_9BORD|nr:hydroxyacid dehydrogenase [Bordetella genomosp. 10]OZI37574.1 3-phosphoglycerate dehydrogenase [Bordetella genomosp. 10]
MTAAAKPRVLVTAADLAPAALDLLRDYQVEYAGAQFTEEQLAGLVARHDPVALIVRYGRITPKVIGAGKSLRVISKHGSGTDNIDCGAAAERGIAIKAATGANAAAVAEHAIALLLACAKSIVAMNVRMHAGHWDKATHKSIELRGKTLGLIGLGAIGRNTAAIAHAMGMRVLGHDPYARDLPDSIVTVPLDRIWAESDAISLHAPLTDETRGIVNAGTLARCRDGVIIVNTARGGLVDESALVAAARSGKVAGAGLDSFSQEPPPADHPYFGIPNLVLSPHVGGVTRDAYVSMGTAAANNVLAVLRDEKEAA